MLRLFPWLILAATLGLACGPADDAIPDAMSGDAGADAAAPTRALEVEGPARLALVFGEEAVIGARYLDRSRQPLAGHVVSFALEGRAHDSTLRAVDVQTDETGFAQTTLVAGSTPAAFRVRITAEDAEPAFVDVSVSDEGFGQLAVEVSHEGTRAVAELGVAVFAGSTCDDEATVTGPGDRYLVRGEGGSEVLFVGLPAGLDYAVVGRGAGPEGDLLAWGCVDGVTVEAGTRTEAAVVAEDLPQRSRGSYQTSLVLEPTRTASELVAAVREVADTLPGDGTLLLDSAERSLRAAGDVDGLNTLTEARTASDADAVLEALLATEGAGPSVALEALRTRLESLAARVEVQGSLRIGDAVSLRVSGLTLGPPEDAYAVDAATIGGLTTELYSAVDPLGEALAIERVSVSLRASQLVTAATRTSGEPAPLEAALAELARCDALPEVPELASSCDAACLASACAEALKFVAMDLEVHLGELDAARGQVVARGDVRLVDDDADLEVDRLEATLTGEWTGERSPEPERLEIEVAGERLTPPS